MSSPNASARPVWVRGRVGYRTRRAVCIVALDRYARELPHVLAAKLLQAERPCRADPQLREFLVPQWWAYKQKLDYQAAGDPLPFLGPQRAAVQYMTQAAAAERMHKDLLKQILARYPDAQVYGDEVLITVPPRPPAV